MGTTNWTVRVDWESPGDVDEPALMAAVEQLADVHGVINIEHPHTDGDPALISATITLDAASLRQATTAALQTVETAAGVKATGIEALTTEAFDRELERPMIPELVGNADIAELLGVSRQRAAQLADIDGFPPAIAHIKAGPIRVRAQVEHWAANWRRKGGRRPKASS